jgi:hypothetical protein
VNTAPPEDLAASGADSSGFNRPRLVSAVRSAAVLAAVVAATYAFGAVWDAAVLGRCDCRATHDVFARIELAAIGALFMAAGALLAWSTCRVRWLPGLTLLTLASAACLGASVLVMSGLKGSL